LNTVLWITLFAAAFQGTGSTASVLIGVEAGGLAGQPLQLQYEINGNPARTVAVAADGDTARVLTRHGLEPGTYRIRIRATEPSTGRTATTFQDVEVPNLTPGLARLAMSDALVTASGVAGLTHTDRDEDRALPVLGQPATTRRLFSLDEKLEVHAELYEQQPPEFEFDSQLRVITRVLDEDGHIAFNTEDTGTSEPLAGNRWGYEHSTLVPISSLPPGNYVVQVIADTLYDVPSSVSRSIPITIVANPVAAPAEKNR
jgi:hypothetical protein